MKPMTSAKTALIIGAGPGISGHFAQALVQAGHQVAIASRRLDKLKHLADSIGAHAFQVDVESASSIQQLFAQVEQTLGAPEVVLFNPSARVKGPITTLDVSQVDSALHSTAMGAFVAAQEAAKRMIAKQTGALFFTGATASVKGFAGSSSFAMGKFAVRGLAQSLARELSPQGIHVAHFVIDGAVKAEADHDAMTAAAIAQTYMAILAQPKAAWTFEIELRSKNEVF
jgi:NAD(P)-dependent dehydrogenase (short-subunit alcohol dehydrogenase family)